MNTEKHTPGPWKVDKHGVITTDSPCYLRSIAETYHENYKTHPGGNAQDKANGLLIAAAPDLLATLKQIAHRPTAEEEVNGEPVLLARGMRYLASVAIARAEGNLKA